MLAEATLEPEPSLTLDPRNLELNETVAGLASRGIKLDLSDAARTRPWC